MRYRSATIGMATYWAAMTTVAACVPSGPPSSHAVLTADAEPLRAAFNRDSGKVRVVMLVAPT
jgi:hypothetical protein